MGTPVKDVTLPDNAPKTLLLQKHADYIAAYGNKKDDYEYIMTEYSKYLFSIPQEYIMTEYPMYLFSIPQEYIMTEYSKYLFSIPQEYIMTEYLHTFFYFPRSTS
ncbi:hypothetical protein ACOMHN_030107 [Nucella lapillus]